MEGFAEPVTNVSRSQVTVVFMKVKVYVYSIVKGASLS